jgi:hypothetical protein
MLGFFDVHSSFEWPSLSMDCCVCQAGKLEKDSSHAPNSLDCADPKDFAQAASRDFFFHSNLMNDLHCFYDDGTL